MAYPILAPNSTWYKGATPRASITEINIVDTYTPNGSVTESWEAAVSGSITCYLIGTVLYISANGNGKIALNADSTAVFSDINQVDYFTSLIRINGAENLDVSGATNLQFFLRSASALTYINVGNWNTSNVTNLKGAFAYCTSLTSLDVAPKTASDNGVNYTAWNIGKVTTLRGIFSGNDYVGDMQLADLPVENWNTSSVTDMTSVFYGCSKKLTFDLSKWDVSNVTTMSHMFADCNGATSFNFTGWDTSKVEDFSALFNDCVTVKVLDLSSFNTKSAKNFSQMFERCYSLVEIIGLDKFDLSGIVLNEQQRVFTEMFMECTSLPRLDLSGFNTNQVYEMEYMFKGCSSLKELIIPWDTSSMRWCGEAFAGCSSLTELDLSTWDSSTIYSLWQTFRDCTNLEAIYVSDKWNLNGLNTEADYRFNTFSNCNKLIGGAGTVYSADMVTGNFAILDGGEANPGYFTYRSSLSSKEDMLIKAGTLEAIAAPVRKITYANGPMLTSQIVETLNETSNTIKEQYYLTEQLRADLEDELGKTIAAPSAGNILDKNTAILESMIGAIEGAAPSGAVVSMNGVEYNSLSIALKMATSGNTITLLANATEPKMLTIPSGVTINLNGFALTAPYVYGEPDSNIIDTSSANTGRLKVPKGVSSLSVNNSYMPFWDGIDGYGFLQLIIQQKITSSTINGDYINFQFACLPRDATGLICNYLGDGANDGDFKIILRIKNPADENHYTTAQFGTHLYPQVYIPNGSVPRGAFIMTMTNLYYLQTNNIFTKAKSGIGVEFNGDVLVLATPSA